MYTLKEVFEATFMIPARRCNFEKGTKSAGTFVGNIRVLFQPDLPVMVTTSMVLRRAQQRGNVSTLSKFWKRGRVLRHSEY